MFVSLAFWQLDRAAEKQALADTLQRRGQAEALPLEVAAGSDDFGHMSRVVLQGHYENQIPFLLTFKFWQGRSGFEVVSPFRTLDGELILVSRGWLPPADDGGLPEVPAVTGEQQIRGQLVVPDVDVPPSPVSDNSWPVRLARLNVEQAGRLLGEPVYPWHVRIGANEAGALTRYWQPERISTRTHYAYAVQWLGIALLVSLATLLYSTNLLSLIKQRRAQRGV